LIDMEGPITACCFGALGAAGGAASAAGVIGAGAGAGAGLRIGSLCGLKAVAGSSFFLFHILVFLPHGSA
jgi:hypothetical protein